MQTTNDLQNDLPSAYRVAEMRGRYYPMRFGRFRLNGAGYRISFGRREDAVAYCHREQGEYERLYPSVADKR